MTQERKQQSFSIITFLIIITACITVYTTIKIINVANNSAPSKHPISHSTLLLTLNKRPQRPRRLLSSSTTDNDRRNVLEAISNNDNRLSPTSNKKIHNFFNCKKEENNHQPLCTYVNIRQFFESTNGLGYNYRQLAFRYAHETIYRDLRFYHINCTTNTNMINNYNINNYLLFDSIPSNLNYIHVHKNGGTTIREAFYNLQKLSSSTSSEDGTTSATSCETKIYESEEIFLGKIRITRAQLVYNVSTFINNIIAKQQIEENNNYNNNDVVVSFIRDPVLRFLSQVGETIRQGVKHPIGHPAPVFGCRENKDTSKEVVQCIINEIKVNGTIVDTHYTPAAIELYLADSRRNTGNKGVNINIYGMKYLRLFLNLLHYDGGDVKMRSATSKEYNKYFDFTLDDLSDDMIQDICKIYEMDVILLNSIGISSIFCQIS